MHFSRMHAARLLTVSQNALPGGVPARGVYLSGNVPSQGGVPAHGGGGVPAHAGVSAHAGVYLPRGSVPARRYLPRGDLPGGVPTWGMYLPWGYLPRGVPAQVQPPPEQNDRQVQKYYLAPNFVCGR